MSWQSALEQVLQTTYDSLEHSNVKWAVVGSTATALQGCQISPHDIDLLTATPEEVYRFAEFMSPFTPPKCKTSYGMSREFYSSEQLLVWAGPFLGCRWRYARWYVDDFEVEVAHLTALEGHSSSHDGTGIWETGPELWQHIQRVSFAGYQVPVSPLEIQLETCLRRGKTARGKSLEPRIDEIIKRFKKDGYDEELLHRSLADRHLEAFKRLMQEAEEA